MRLCDFHVFSDTWPLVSSGQNDSTGRPGGDQLILVQREPISIDPVVFIGCHREATVEVRSAANTTAVETAAAWTTLNLPAGGKTRINLPGTGNFGDIVTKITPVTGQIYVTVVAFGEFNGYFKQVQVY